MNNDTLKKITNMRMGVCSNDQYIVSDYNINQVLSNNKYQNTWLTGLIKCAEYIKSNTTVERMVEIGCYQGESTTLFAHIIKPNVLYAIDPFKNGYDDTDTSSTGDFTDIIYNFNERIKMFPCITHIAEFSYDVVNKFEDSSLDFVYIDGNHSYEGVVRDIKSYLPKIKKTGFLAGHDLGRESVTNAIQDTFGEVDIYFEDSSWIKKII